MCTPYHASVVAGQLGVGAARRVLRLSRPAVRVYAPVASPGCVSRCNSTGDGVFAIEFVGCGGTSIELELFTANSGWVDVGSASAGTCVFGSGDWTIPEAYLDEAIDGSNRIRFRWSVDDSCAAGVGCNSYSEPCVKNARLIYPR